MCYADIHFSFVYNTEVIKYRIFSYLFLHMPYATTHNIKLKNINYNKYNYTTIYNYFAL